MSFLNDDSFEISITLYKTQKLKCMNLLFELQIRRNKNEDEESMDEAGGRCHDNDVLRIEEAVHNLVDTLNNEQAATKTESTTNSSSSSMWSIFRLARMCVRYAYYDLAYEIYTLLAAILARDGATGVVSGGDSSSSTMSTSDLSYKCWFEFMSHVCQAEHFMTTSRARSDSVNQLIASLNDALSNYMRAQVPNTRYFFNLKNSSIIFSTSSDLK